MVKGVIFDIDGVLLDSMEIWEDLGARYLRSLGKEPEDGLAAVLFSMSMEQGASYLAEKYSLSQTPEAVMEGLSTMLRDFYFYEVKAKTGARELMEYLKAGGIRMTAATSSPREHVERALERNGLLGFLDRIFTVAEIGISKHSPDIYDIAAAFMKNEPGGCAEDAAAARYMTGAECAAHARGEAESGNAADAEGAAKALDTTNAACAEHREGAAKALGTANEDLRELRSDIYVFEDSLYALKTAADAGYHAVGVFDAKGEADQEGLRECAEIYVKELTDLITDNGTTSSLES